jgi:hypothetical protein
VRKEMKRGKYTGKTELLTRYTPIGIVDDFMDVQDGEGGKFSIAGQIKGINVGFA